MKDIPPSLASAIAMLSSETACIIAEVIGMFIDIGDSSSPFLNFTNGVFKLTLAGIQLAEEYPGTSRYSLKV